MTDKTTALCPACGVRREYRECDWCNGSGFTIDDSGISVPCAACGGERGWYECATVHTTAGAREEGQHAN